MKPKKIPLAAVFACVLLAIGLIWHLTHYHIIGFRAYPRDARSLDLRGQNISADHYRKLSQALPGCEILWDVPLQDTVFPSDTETLTLSQPEAADLQTVALFPKLRTLDIRGCEDYGLIRAFRETYPDLALLYTVTVSGTGYDQDADTVTVDGLSLKELDGISLLPNLKQVQLASGKDAPQLMELIQFCQKGDIALRVLLGGKYRDMSAPRWEISGITDEEIRLLSLLPRLNTLVLPEPEAAADSLSALVLAHPEANIRWEKTLMGTAYSSDCTHIDLTAAISPEGAYACAQGHKAHVHGTKDPIAYQFKVNDDYPLPDLTEKTAAIIAETEEALAYFPQLQQVTMCGSIFDNEAMADFRERHRTEYKVVWSVQLGDKLVARTDTPYLMPTKFHVYYFLDKDAVNLKYCPEIVSMDLGHMAIRNIDWITYMPDLTYLVLAHTQLLYIEPISSCKSLKFLELDWSPIRDFTPLKGCTALEDLNLGNTYADFSPIREMTWLKNLWMIGCTDGLGYRMTQALPDTKVMISGSATVANGWRHLPNYYAMRDAMNMYYMTW